MRWRGLPQRLPSTSRGHIPSRRNSVMLNMLTRKCRIFIPSRSEACSEVQLDRCWRTSPSAALWKFPATAEHLESSLEGWRVYPVERARSDCVPPASDLPAECISSRGSPGFQQGALLAGVAAPRDASCWLRSSPASDIARQVVDYVRGRWSHCR